MSLPGPDGPGDTGVADPHRHELGTASDAGVAAASTTQGGRHFASEQRTRSRGSFFVELPVLVLVAFVLALLIKTFLIQAFYIPSESMLPTLAVGDRVLVNKLSHEFREPERGEVVVFSQEDGPPGVDTDANPVVRTFQSLASGLGFVQTGEKDFIKRIVGLPGETIEMRDGVIYVEGRVVPEASEDDGGYLTRPDLVDFGPVEVPDDEYFLMGDNRPNSSDSRAMLGTIHEDDLVGRAFAIVWPFDRLTVLSIPDYGADAVTDGEPVPVGAEEPATDDR